MDQFKITSNEAIKALEERIQAEDQKMEALRETNPDKVGEKFCYIVGLSKAVSIIKAV